jgi:hypothetical protein
MTCSVAAALENGKAILVNSPIGPLEEADLRLSG